MTRRNASRPGEDPIVEKAFGKGSEQDLAAAISQLTPGEAEMFLHKLEAALRKRKIMLSGYLVAIVSWLVAMVLAIVYFGTASGFVVWVFLVPFAIVGVILWGFGWWADNASRATIARAPSAPPQPPPSESHPP